MLTIMFPVVDDLLYEKEKKELCTNAYLFQSRVMPKELRSTYNLLTCKLYNTYSRLSNNCDQGKFMIDRAAFY